MSVEEVLSFGRVEEGLPRVGGAEKRIRESSESRFVRLIFLARYINLDYRVVGKWTRTGQKIICNASIVVSHLWCCWNTQTRLVFILLFVCTLLKDFIARCDNLKTIQKYFIMFLSEYMLISARMRWLSTLHFGVLEDSLDGDSRGWKSNLNG